MQNDNKLNPMKIELWHVGIHAVFGDKNLNLRLKDFEFQQFIDMLEGKMPAFYKINDFESIIVVRNNIDQNIQLILDVYRKGVFLKSSHKRFIYTQSQTYLDKKAKMLEDRLKYPADMWNE